MPATGAMDSVGRGPPHHMYGVPPHPMMALPPAQGQPQQYPQPVYSPWMGHHPQQVRIGCCLFLPFSNVSRYRVFVYKIRPFRMVDHVVVSLVHLGIRFTRPSIKAYFLIFVRHP